MTPDHDLYIHIPEDLFDDDSSYRCPPTVSLELQTNQCHRQRSVGVYPTPRETTLAEEPCISDLAKEIAKRNRKDVGSPALWGHVKKKVPIVGRGRGMEAEDEGLDFLGNGDVLDIIDVVAQANDTSNDSNGAAFLPELRASPCLIHHRTIQKHHLPLHQQQQTQRSDARNDLLYSTSYHGGHNTNMSLASRRSPSGSNRDESRIQLERDITFQKDMQAGRSHIYKRPTLPKEMTSEDFVTSWLEHGSEPQGMSHFPEIVPGRTSLSRTSSPTKNSGKKQTLSPIKPHNNTTSRRKAGGSHISE